MWHPAIYCGKKGPAPGVGRDDVALAGIDKPFSKAKGRKPLRLPDSNPDRIAPPDVEPEKQ